jgi:hypothetical protein
LGRDLTLEVGPKYCKTYMAEWKPEYAEKAKQANGGPVPPEFSMTVPYSQGADHMRNFIDCVHSRELPRCNINRAWEEAVTIMMSVESFRREKKVRWDPQTETIV